MEGRYDIFEDYQGCESGIQTGKVRMKRLITILIEDEEPAEVTELLDDIKTFLHGELSGVTVIEIKSEDKND